MNAPKQPNRESGQMIVLLAFGLLALLGLTAVAIDGGMIYADRRYDQNAADSASYAGAGAAAMALENTRVTYDAFRCNSMVNQAKQDAVSSAISRAASNNFAIDTHLDDQQGVEVTCGVEPKGVWYDKYLDVHTMISSDLQTAFAHLFYSGNIRNTVEAVARVRPRSDLSYGFAITALGPDCHEGVEFDGDSEVKVRTTGVFSNSCITTNGGVDVTTIPRVGETIRPPISWAGDEPNIIRNGASGTITANIIKSPHTMPRVPVPAPNCSASGMNSQPNPSLEKNVPVEVEPGRYDTIKVTNDEILVMQPGLYCLTGDFDAQGGKVQGDGVTIYMISGSLKINGQTEVQLSAPMGETSPAIRGMLFYAAESNTSTHSLSGGATSYYIGTLFAPYGEIAIGGNSEVGLTYSTQIVANSVKIHGTADMDIQYDAAVTYSNPAYLELYR